MKNKVTGLIDPFNYLLSESRSHNTFKSDATLLQSILNSFKDLESFDKNEKDNNEAHDYDVDSILNELECNSSINECDVTIIIPSVNGVNVIQAINSLGNAGYKIIVGLNNTNFEKQSSYIKSNLSPEVDVDIEIVNYQFSNNIKFSFSEICNKLFDEYCRTDYCVFFNDDLTINRTDLNRVISYLSFNTVGAVAPALLWHGDIVQNAGIFGGIHRNNLPGLYARGQKYHKINKMPLAADAVTGACLCIKSSLFKTVGGFNEEHFAVAYNDVDLGFRLNELGYMALSLNHIAAYHAEGATRGTGLGNDNPAEEVAISQRYEELKKKVVKERIGMILDPESGEFLTPNSHPVIQGCKNSRNVVVFTHNMKLEGASKVAYDVAELLHDNGFNVYVLALEEGELHKKYSSFAKDILTCTWGIFNSPEIRAQVSLWLTSHKIDFAICNTIISSTALNPITTSLDISQINYIHESEPFYFHVNHFGHYWVEQSALSIANNFNIFVSKYTVDVYRQFLNNSNWTVLYNYYQPQTSQHDENQDVDILNFVTVGTICDRKNQKMVFEAMDFFEDKKVKAKFTLVGARESEYLNELKALQADTSYKYAQLEIIPETPDVNYYYSKADVLISFSKMESFPITLLEASNHNLALISSDVFGAKEMIVDGVNGFLYRSNDVDSLNSSLNDLLHFNIEEVKANSKLMLSLWPDKKVYLQGFMKLIR